MNGRAYPIVKMEWAAGATLGEFLQQNHRSKEKLRHLRASLAAVATYLEGQSMAHGDVQPGNVMVSNEGRSLQLIDYDGMYVEELRPLGSSELGHRNFQHPLRSGGLWNSNLDRFSFIALDLALRLLEEDPALWNHTQSDGDAILFRANDLSSPSQSALFMDLLQRPNFADTVGDFMKVCAAEVGSVPTLADFVAGRNIPVIVVAKSTSVSPSVYQSAYSVLDATAYAAALHYVGDRVELIGKVVDVKHGKTKHGLPYVFVNFGPWRGSIVKVAIWSDGLAAMTDRPSGSWVGKWVSVVGLVEPPYNSQQYGYSHIAVNVTAAGQLRIINEDQARYRLGSASRPNNGRILEQMTARSGRAQGAGSTTTQSRSRNQAVVRSMQSSTGTHGRPSPTPPRAAVQRSTGTHGRPSRPPIRPTKMRKPTVSDGRTSTPSCVVILVMLTVAYLLLSWVMS
ncbi:MAG: serine/threonine protein kinase [Coriobacteriia bacterium]|nr:serine/threonine protein kinase [Coriobacteriia bacterium]